MRFSRSILLIGLLPGCGSDSAGPSGGPSGAGYDSGTSGGDSGASFPDGGVTCSFAVGGGNGAATTTPAAEEQVVTSQIMAQNTMVLDLPLRSNAIGRGPCGTVGLVYRGELGGYESLRYVDITDGVGTYEEFEFDAGSAPHAALVFDDDCDPVVIRASSSAITGQWVRTDGTWGLEAIDLDLLGMFGEWPNPLVLWWAGRVADGDIHLVATLALTGEDLVLHGRRGGAPGAAWTFETKAAPEATEIQQLKVGPDGAVHAVYQKTEYPCDPCNLDLYHGELPAGADAWIETVLQAGMWGPPHDEEAIDPSLVLDSEGEAWVAATFERRSITGSPILSELRLYGRSGSGWCGETPSMRSDEYEGGDGDGFTGARPILAIDDDHRFHIVFSDVSHWHDAESRANAIIGQVRHAVRTGDRWSTSMLIRQRGQTVSAEPLEGVWATQFSLAPGGGELHVAATKGAWDSGSIYNGDAVPLTLETVALSGAIEIAP